MADIDFEDKGSVLNPLRAWAFLGRKPVTEPLEPRLASLNYRGFHLNDWEKCIGCSTCQKVCDNAAITMVRIPGLPQDPVKGVRNERPAIDYGRCCWCGLCVDICPTGSLSLSREYVHTCTDDQLSSYFVLPDPKGMHGKYYGHGWTKTADSDLVDLVRQPMAELEPQARSANFDEIVAGYDDQQALLEASRCVQCGMCHDACPTHMNAPEYIRAIWEGKVEEAVRWIYETNPFSHVCGRVCTHRCEDACSVGRRGTPIAIRWLKRYAMDAVPHERVKQIAAAGRLTHASGRRVAIVGAGPAGLTAAFDLARKGHGVTVFEALDKPGGMTRWGIPEYRLPYDKLDQDIDVIRSVGVDIRCNVRIGRDITLEQLRSDYDAVLIALGLQTGRSTRVPNSEHPQVRKSVELLRQVTAGEDIGTPRSAVVIGGGNVAMDIARTGPQECLVDAQGRLTGLRTWRVKAIFDEQGRFAPSYDSDDERIHPGEMVVEAIGQASDTSLLGDALTEKLEWRRGRLDVDAGGRTSEPWLWAAGDMVRGPDVVNAVADGHRVAASIHAHIGVPETVR
ncbi:MAG: FAD-dependent pyridine nucleotide-disulfide oxidoreductase [Proteobacteria bacterium]|nr:FAD-dependent pyridine nucleotide-disulfide oxidoreductase [Pseudomonadota bacterium]